LDLFFAVLNLLLLVSIALVIVLITKGKMLIAGISKEDAIAILAGTALALAISYIIAYFYSGFC
jgi:hypothetical protein